MDLLTFLAILTLSSFMEKQKNVCILCLGKDILCGFVASLDELRAWESTDRAQLVLDTKPVYRNLAELCPQITCDDIRRAVQQGTCVIYHASSHNIYFMQETGRFFLSYIRAQGSR